jgi:hypothetical protein
MENTIALHHILACALTVATNSQLCLLAPYTQLRNVDSSGASILINISLKSSQVYNNQAECKPEYCVHNAILELTT